MNNECGAQTSDEDSIYTCNRCSGHSGRHRREGSDGVVYMQWDRDSAYQPWFEKEYKSGVLGQFHETPEVVLRLTLEELKGIVYALSSPDWREDEPELVAKIDKALKEML
jgi:hypothetical protein